VEPLLRQYTMYTLYTMSLPRPICTRMPPDLEVELERRLDELDWSPSRGLRNIVGEWLAVQRYPDLEFRDTALGRRAAIRAGPEVWEVVAVADSPGVTDGGVAHFSWVRPTAIEQANAYAAEAPEEIRRIIERNRRLADRSRS